MKESLSNLILGILLLLLIALPLIVMGGFGVMFSVFAFFGVGGEGPATPSATGMVGGVVGLLMSAGFLGCGIYCGALGIKICGGEKEKKARDDWPKVKKPSNIQRR